MAELTDEYEGLDKLIKEMEGDIPSSGYSGLNRCYVGGDSEFEMRLCTDHNGKLHRHVKAYKGRVKLPSEIEGREPVLRTIYALPKTGEGADYLNATAKELGWRYTPNNFYIFYGEITSIKKGEGDYFKLGPCILVCQNKKFMEALLGAMKSLREKKPQALLASLDPKQEGLKIEVVTTSGQQGTTRIQYDSFGDLHKFKLTKNEGSSESFNPLDLFTDINSEVIPTDEPTLDANYELLYAEFGKILKDRQDYNNKESEGTPIKSEFDSGPEPSNVSSDELLNLTGVDVTSPPLTEKSANDELDEMLHDQVKEEELKKS